MSRGTGFTLETDPASKALVSEFQGARECSLNECGPCLLVQKVAPRLGAREVHGRVFPVYERSR